MNLAPAVGAPIYLGLGANAGDRRANLERALDALVDAGFRLQQVSPLVESPALLPPGADSSWHKPYLNLVAGGDADWRPQQGLAIVKQIERDLGRRAGPRWSPRPIDIDLLRWRGYETDADGLTLPHIALPQRDFVLTPLLHLQPDLPVGEHGERVLEVTRQVRPLPLWMAVVNLTPDSFSDGGARAKPGALDDTLDQLLAGHIPIIDMGAESTRPGAEALTPAAEWKRLEPALAAFAERCHGRRIKPWLSVDSRHPATIDKALRYGLDIINDVGGLASAEMRALARANGCQVVALHNLGVPPDPAVCLPFDVSAVVQVREWAERQMEDWASAGLDLNRIILDPGIGFGKTAIQAFELLSNCAELRCAGLRLLIGHSRKSFMNGFTARPPAQRDLETLGLSLALCQQGVDIIRVHSPLLHQRAYLAWAHVAGSHRVVA